MNAPLLTVLAFSLAAHPLIDFVDRMQAVNQRRAERVAAAAEIGRPRSLPLTCVDELRMPVCDDAPDMCRQLLKLNKRICK